jgi:hypothetical protein
MPADVIQIGTGAADDSRPKEDRAYQAVVAAVRALVEARDATMSALDEFAEAFVAGEHETYEEFLALPLGEILRRQSTETIALWHHIGFVKANLEEADAFDVLTRLDMPELEEAFATWKRANGLGGEDDAV